MTHDPDDGEKREPWWEVTTVYDPQGGGSDFSYTVGLARDGLPEVHLWARPTLGEDPGADWMLSPCDTTRLAHRLAWRLIDGRLAVGDTWEEEYDAGFVRARFEVHPAVPGVEVDALGAGQGPVLPVRWELLREPVGELRTMDPAAQREAHQRHRAVLGRLDDHLLGPPPGWPDPVSLDWSAEADLGPRTPLVLARAAQVWSSSEGQLLEQASNALVLSGGRPPAWATTVARAAARGAGRAEVVDRVEEAAAGLVRDLGLTWGHRACEAVRSWLVAGMTADDARASWDGMRVRLTEQVTALLVVEAVADLLPDHVIVWGQGPVLCALAENGMPPDERWACSASVAEAVTALAGRVRVADLLEAAQAWQARQGTDEELQVEAVRLTAATHAPYLTELLPMSAILTARSALERQGLPLATLQNWFHALAAVLSERAALSPRAVDDFVVAGRSVAGLAALVDTPLVAAAAR